MPVMHYTADNCMAELLQALPEFQQQWDDHLAAHPGEAPDLVADLAELAAHAHVLLARGQHATLQQLLALAEQLLRDGDPQVQRAVCSGFLESLADPLTPGEPGLTQLLAALGPASRAYLRHWQGFSARVLPGL